MTNYVEVGVRDNDCNSVVPTKKALKERLLSNPASLTFTTVSAFAPKQHLKGTELDHTVKYTVVGPDVDNSRKWYATVEFNQMGRIVVK